MKVIYIAGRGHSGSTILDLLLGNAFEIDSVGEFSSLRKDGSYSCASCGHECEVLNSVFQKLELTSKELTEKLKYLEAKNRLLVGLKEYAHMMDVIYMTYDLKNKDVVIDSSKDYFKALKLRLSGLDVHLVLIQRGFSATINSYRNRYSERGTWNVFGKKRQLKYYSGIGLVTIGYIYGFFFTFLLSLSRKSILVNYDRLSNEEYFERVLRKLKMKSGECNVYEDQLEPGHRQRGNKVLRQSNIRYEKKR